MNVSIIIPVYNEADNLAACLEAIAAQTVAPYEVIVVDNNSTDETARIASHYDFVTLLSELKQGVIHARTTGFDYARGDILARLDGDSIISTDWVASVKAIFQDASLDAVSGQAYYYNVAAAELFNGIDLFFRRRLERQLAGNVYLWGANMALRRTAWLKTKQHLCRGGGLHEDYDIAIHLQEIGGKVIFDERLKVAVSSRRIDVGYLSFMKYVLVSPGTYAQHGVRSRWHMYEVVAVCALGYLPARLLHRGYDPLLERFSWLRLLTGSPTLARPDPTSNVV
jgi:glycosyltransferase involved in cell wall biosynthesis